MRNLFLLILLIATSFDAYAQLKLGSVRSEINFREGPGLNYKVAYTINSSNLLVILPRAPQNNFIEVFDIETSSYGFVSENLILVTDTLNFQKQYFSERSVANETGGVEIEMINHTSKTLYIWINSNTYNLFPFEKKSLLMDSEDIVFFTSSPGLFPVFGKEILKKGSSYQWDITSGLSAVAQQRDTLKLNIKKIDRQIKADTVFYYSSRVDTIALQTIKTDTSKIVKDINLQDLEESKYMIKFMGSVRVNGLYDFSGMKSTEGFLPYEIPVGADDIPGLSSIYIGARQSRLGIEGSANTKVGKIKTYMEVDFASSTDSFWRLRQAYAEWNFLKLGYTWTTFTDNASLPMTVEFEGPNSSLSKKHGLIRYERILQTQNIFGISLESPAADYFNPYDSVTNSKSNQRNLDLAGRYKYFNKWGHIQLAGILRQIDIYQQGKMDLMHGWGILLSTSVHISGKHQINAQYSTGKGIAYYSVGFSGKQLDAIYNPGTDNMELKLISGGFVNYSFRYNPELVFSVICGISQIKCEDFEPGDSFKSSQYFGANIFYNPIQTITLGLEATGGTRKNLDNQKGYATRISVLAQFDF